MGDNLRYEPTHYGRNNFAGFMLSEQIRLPLRGIAHEIIAVAKGFVPPSDDPRNGHYSEHFSTVDGTEFIATKREVRTVRAVVYVENDAPSAAAMEFGSGAPSVGTSKGQPRKQGGSNQQKRPLGRASMIVGAIE